MNGIHGRQQPTRSTFMCWSCPSEVNLAVTIRRCEYSNIVWTCETGVSTVLLMDWGDWGDGAGLTSHCKHVKHEPKYAL